MVYLPFPASCAYFQSNLNRTKQNAYHVTITSKRQTRSGLFTTKTLITITPLQWHVQDNATETIILQVVPTDKSMLTICVVKYDMLLHDVMEFLCLMSDGLVKTGTTKCIKHIFTKFFLHKKMWNIKQAYLFWTSLKFFEYLLWIQPNLLTQEIRCYQRWYVRTVTSCREWWSRAVRKKYYLRLIPEKRR